MKISDFSNVVFATSKISDGNMDFLAGDTKEVLANREKFLSSFNIPISSIISLKQPHENKIIRVDLKNKGQGSKKYDTALEADGLITNIPNLYLVVKAADCHQIAFFDSKNKAIGLIHAGWKGLDLKIVQNLIIEMRISFNSQPKDLIVKFGPYICCECYNFKKLGEKDKPSWKPFIYKLTNNNSFEIDIGAFAFDKLIKMGVKRKNIEDLDECTYHLNKYFSHRKAVVENLIDDFRFITVLGLKN